VTGEGISNQIISVTAMAQWRRNVSEEIAISNNALA